MKISTIFRTLLVYGVIVGAMMQQTSSDMNLNESSPAELKKFPTYQGNANCGPSTKVCSNSRYRSFDGSCNNLKRPNWGAALTPYVRLTKANYADGISKMPISVTGYELPNARELSLWIFTEELVVDPYWNLNGAQYGQTIAHDMSLTANVAEILGEAPIHGCCDNPDPNPACATISIPLNDPIRRIDGRRCMNFVRTGTTRDEGCATPNAPAQQLTAVTAFIDLSIVYGNSESQNARLRAGKRGRLLTLRKKGQEWPPQVSNATTTCICTVQSGNQPCYLAGDIRVNQNAHLTLLQVVLLREHNRIADKLASLNRHWDDETLFQEARRILIACIQHINYYEYLPILLGSETMVQHKLIYPEADGYVDDYNPNVNPSIINEYANAAFRHFHNLIRGHLQMLSKRREIVEIVRLSDWLSNPQLLENNDGLNKLVRGLTTEHMRESTQYWSAELTDYFCKRNNTYGDDLRALDIQRGRDHGLGTYLDARAACHLSVPETYDDMREYISGENIAMLQELYASIEDIDLVVGGSLEYPEPGAKAGPTFLCILIEQFYRTRVGDRYFYENRADPDIAFTPSQLATIRKGAKMARLLCDNANGIHEMQPNAFRVISENNQLESCEQLPSIDLTLWRDEEYNQD